MTNSFALLSFNDMYIRSPVFCSTGIRMPYLLKATWRCRKSQKMGKVLSYSEKKKKTRTIQWEELTNEMDPGIDSCLTPLNPLGHTA